MARGIARVLGEERVASVCADDYLRSSRERSTGAGHSVLHPDSFYLDIVEQHLCLLRQGEPVLAPSYNAETGESGAPLYIEPRPFVIVEGTLGYWGDALPGHYDVRLYLEPREETRIKWKIQHDREMLGRSERDVVKELAQASPDAEAFVKPQRRWADMVVNIDPAGDGERGDRHMGASLILRPSLPHLDLAALVDTGAARGAIALELDRDMGLPVDRLDIRGGMTDDQAAALEEMLAGYIPDGHRPAGDDGNEISPALRLTQLLAAVYLNMTRGERQQNSE